MESYILQILENNSRVIVPEFGAFIVKQRNPFTVVFNEFLQYNDGVLIDAISKNEGISREDAKQKVDDFIKQINTALEHGEYFPIGKLGAIAKGSSGKISLEKADDLIKPGKPKGKETASIEQPKKSPTVTKRKTDSNVKSVQKTKQAAAVSDMVQHREAVDSAEEVNKKEESKDKDPIIPTIEEQKEQPSREIAKPLPTKEVKAKVPDPITEVKQSLNTVSTETSSASVYKRSNVVLWVIIILLINAILIGYFIYSDELKGLFMVKYNDTLLTEPFFEETVPAAEVFEDETPVNETSSDATMPDEYSPPGAEQVEVLSSGVRYYVVAGVFREEQNAIKFVNDLRKKWFHAEKFGRIGRLHAVSYAVFGSKTDADRFLEKIHQETDPEAWIRMVNH